MERMFLADPNGRIVIVWCHDESIFYRNDRRKLRWVHESATAKPYTKGEGPSIMAGDYVSPDYGWLRGRSMGPDGSVKSARTIFRPGKTPRASGGKNIELL